MKFEYEFTLKQEKEIAEFKEHECKYSEPGSMGAIDCRFSYEFTITSVAPAVVFSCKCGREINITDYENW